MAKSPASELTLRSANAGGLLGATLLFSMFTNLLMLTGPLFMLQVYDRVLASRSEETLVALFGLVAGLYLLYGFLEYARGRVMARAGARYYSSLAPRIFDALIERSALRPKDSPGATALADLESIRRFLASPALLAIFDLPWTPVFLAGIFIFHPMLGWLAMAGGALLIVVTLLNQLLTRSAQERAQGMNQGAHRFAKQAESGGGLVWAQGMAPAMGRRWLAMQTGALKEDLSTQDRTGGFTTMTRAFRFFLQSAMLALGAWLVLQNQVTPGAMIAASILLGRALAPIEQTVGQWALVQQARLGRQHLIAFLGSVPQRPEPTRLPAPKAHLSVRNVSAITSPGAPPILHGISFEVNPGEALGVIGRSGAGKTSLARIITGLGRAATGEIRLGGATLDQYSAEARGRYIGYLPQDVVMFEGTIADNIARMSTDPDPDKIVAAAQKARVHDIILKLPEGYDTRLTVDDARLSGGQKQRVALARALYDDPMLLVLDEPNSALDADGSEALNAAIDNCKAEGRAVLIMTHRPTAIASCDRLLLLEAGRAAAYGPRDDVIKQTMRNASAVGRVVAGGKQ